MNVLGPASGIKTGSARRALEHGGNGKAAAAGHRPKILRPVRQAVCAGILVAALGAGMTGAGGRGGIAGSGGRLGLTAFGLRRPGFS
jgi:hypothetical protein